MENISGAISDFQKARRRASLEQIYARLTGKSVDLLSYEEVRRRVRASQQVERGLQDVPLEDIVGSVGRYKDFTRSFLPKEAISENRWANVKTQNLSDTGLPPVELYKIGDVYFVLDGNHRVSVAREMGLQLIQAYVTEVLTKVKITKDMEPDDLIIAEQYTHFLDKTKLDELRPQMNMQVTAPGKYPLLLEHIEVHRYFMGLDFKRDVSYEEAVAHWYDHVYLPVVDMIRKRGILREFPERTETDLYIWLAEHRAELEKALGWEISFGEAIETFAEDSTSLLTRMGEYIYGSISGENGNEDPLSKLPAEPESKPARETDRLFREILVSVGENDASWEALEQAAILAEKEGANLRGLHFTPKFEPHEHDPAAHHRFDAILQERGLSGRLADASGDWARVISNRARWSDILVLGIQHPPDGTLLTRLASEWRQVLQYSPRPVLAVPRRPSLLNKALIAYDGSRRSRQSLYVGAYLATHWQIPITIIAVGDGSLQEKTLSDARGYLEQMDITAEYIGVKGDVATNILVTLESNACDFIVMGGYGKNPLRELFTSSAVDHVLRNSWQPVLVCQ